MFCLQSMKSISDLYNRIYFNICKYLQSPYLYKSYSIILSLRLIYHRNSDVIIISKFSGVRISIDSRENNWTTLYIHATLKKVYFLYSNNNNCGERQHGNKKLWSTFYGLQFSFVHKPLPITIRCLYVNLSRK